METDWIPSKLCQLDRETLATPPPPFGMCFILLDLSFAAGKCLIPLMSVGMCFILLRF